MSVRVRRCRECLSAATVAGTSALVARISCDPSHRRGRAAVRLESVSFSFTAEPLLDGVTFTVGDGERACLVGPNDCGKTTLLRLVAGDLVPDSDTLRAPAVAPVPDVLTRTGDIGDYLDAAAAPLRSMTTRFETITARLVSCPDDAALVRDDDELFAAMTAADVWNLNIRITSVLAGLGLGGLAETSARSRELASLSPGRRGRLSGRYSDHPPRRAPSGRADQPPRRRGSLFPLRDSPRVGGPRPAGQS